MLPMPTAFQITIKTTSSSYNPKSHPTLMTILTQPLSSYSHPSPPSRHRHFLYHFPTPFPHQIIILYSTHNNDYCHQSALTSLTTCTSITMRIMYRQYLKLSHGLITNSVDCGNDNSNGAGKIQRIIIIWISTTMIIIIIIMCGNVT